MFQSLLPLHVPIVTPFNGPSSCSNMLYHRLKLHSLAENMGPLETEEMKTALINMGILGLEDVKDPYELFLKLEPKHIGPSDISLLLRVTQETESLRDLNDILSSYNSSQHSKQ